jgi:ankyrin repeat protein
VIEVDLFKQFLSENPWLCLSFITSKMTTINANELLYSAVEEGSVEKLYEAVAASADINFVFRSKALPDYKYKGHGTGNSALHLACWQGLPVAFIERMLELNCNIHLKSMDNCYTPLHCSVRSGKIEIVELLLASGSDLKDKDNDGYSPLHYAAIEGHKEIAELLIDRGSDPNEKDLFGNTPLHSASLKGRKEVVELLINRGSSVYARGENSGYIPLHWSAQMGHGDIVTLLLDRGSEINERTNKGSTPLHCAAFQGRKDAVGILLSRGSDFHLKNDVNWTALSMASINDYNPIVKVLNYWPTTMLVIVTQEICVYNLLDLSSIVDFFEYFGVENLDLF